MAADLGVIRTPSDVWRRLASRDITEDALIADQAIPDKPGRLLAGVDRLGRRHYLVKLEPDEQPLDDAKSRGLEIATRDLSPVDGEKGRYIDIVCLQPAGHDVFDALGGELAAILAVATEQPAIVAKRVIAKWRQFWLAPVGPSLGREEQLGLFAELWFLTFWLVPVVGVIRALKAWRGPHGSRHDVEMSGISFEVKASTSRSIRSHEIHGIDQLAWPDGGQLFLYSAVLADEGGGTNTLPGIVSRLRDLASADDEATVVLESGLSAVGYSATSIEDLDLRIRVVDELLYRVDQGFPRIVRGSFHSGNVPSGVGMISYSIHLSGAERLIVARRPEDMAPLFRALP
jgi:hypothetical protein